MLWDLIQWSVLRKAFIYKQIPLNLAWDQVPHCGEKGEKVGVGEKNKIDERSEPRGSLGSGKGGRPSPLTRIPLGSLCSPIFFLFDPFLFSLFFPPTAEPGPRLVLTNSLRKCVRDWIWILGHIRLNYFFLDVGRLSRVIEKPASILTSLFGFSSTYPCFSDIVSDLLTTFFTVYWNKSDLTRTLGTKLH